jgi:hypothetical protein
MHLFVVNANTEVHMQPWLWVWLLAFPLLPALVSLAGVFGAKAPRRQ